MSADTYAAALTYIASYWPRIIRENTTDRGTLRGCLKTVIRTRDVVQLSDETL